MYFPELDHRRIAASTQRSVRPGIYRVGAIMPKEHDQAGEDVGKREPPETPVSVIQGTAPSVVLLHQQSPASGAMAGGRPHHRPVAQRER
jgi:hypothetical protein